MSKEKIRTMADKVGDERVVSAEAIRLILRIKTSTVQDLVSRVSHVRSKMEQARTVEDVTDIENELADLKDAYRAKSYQIERLMYHMFAVKVDLMPKPKEADEDD